MALYILCPLEFIQVERGDHAFRARFLIYADTAAPFRRLFLAGGFLDCREVMIVFTHAREDLLSRFFAFSVVSVCFTGSNTMTRPLFVLAMGLGSASSSDISIPGPIGIGDACCS